MKESTHQRIILFLSALLIVVAPLFRASNRPLPLLILEFLGITILLITFWNTKYGESIPRLLWVMIISIVATPLLYLIPLPESLINSFPGRELYHSVAQWAESYNEAHSRIMVTSVAPKETIDSFLRIIPAIAIFITTLTMNINNVKLLCYIFLALSGLEALIAVAQSINGSDALYFGMKNSHVSQGTYPNRNHFVALMEMSLPITIGLLASISLSQSKRSTRYFNLLKKLTSTKHLILFMLALSMLIASILSQSRAGIFLVLLGSIIAILTYARHSKDSRPFSTTITLSVLSIGIASSIGIIPVINHFIENSPFLDGRWMIFEHTIEAIKDFYPIGSGSGTFPYIYRAYQPIEQSHFINNAHNDYLELLFETGLIGTLLLFMFFIVYYLNWKNILQGYWLAFRYIQAGAGIGMFSLLLHSSVDFNFHIPANMIFFALLAGIFFHSVEKESVNKQKLHCKRKIHKRRTTVSINGNKVESPRMTTLKKKKNPFFDE